MGRRRKARKPPPKAKMIVPLDVQFNCPFCNHEKSCEVKLNKQARVGSVSCRVCLEDFQTSINYLTEPIDVYSEWIDACEEANAAASSSASTADGGGGHHPVGFVSGKPMSGSAAPPTAAVVGVGGGAAAASASAVGGSSSTVAAAVAAAAAAAADPAHNLELASLFECPVCFDFALPPILQCQAGHIVCAACRSKLSSCPTCRGPLANIRNLIMDKLAAQVLFPCKYVNNGCSDCFLHTSKTEHEDVCEFRPYTCPCPGASCKWQGSLEQVMNHLTQQHKSITTLQGEDIIFLATDINLPGAVDWVMMQSCFGYNFMLVLEKQERSLENQVMFYAIVQLIGNRKQADQFAYRLELNGQRRRLTWEATPRSIHDGVQAAIANSDCLVFDSNIASLFAETGNLGISVTISMAGHSASSPNQHQLLHQHQHHQAQNSSSSCSSASSMTQQGGQSLPI
uniref:E3 ubiquitin-protein ligase n=1 Tax=Macrostomum lignano TaxID=282301 RepID=A0A1I8GIA0_9PLAT